MLGWPSLIWDQWYWSRTSESGTYYDTDFGSVEDWFGTSGTHSETDFGLVENGMRHSRSILLLHGSVEQSWVELSKAVQGVTDKLAKILLKKNIKTSFKPLTTIRQRMKSVKDNPEHLQQKGVYIINCSCGEQYIGETGRLVSIRLKEHSADIRWERTRSSALAEHAGKTNHHICLENTKVIANEKHHFKRKVREALEIIKHPHNLNRDGGLEISRNWTSLLTPIE